MPAFEYEALDGAGKSKRGVVSADSPRQARSELRRINLVPVKIDTPRSDRKSGDYFNKTPRITPAKLVILTRHLAALVSASTPRVSKCPRQCHGDLLRTEMFTRTSLSRRELR